MNIRPEASGKTDVGRVRKVNEDQFLIAELSKWMEVHQTSLPIHDSTRLSSQRSGHLYLVADGLGGAPAGEVASSLAVDTVVRYVLNAMPWFFRVERQEAEVEAELKKVLENCQSKIESDVAQHPSHSGMGTTLTMAYVIWPELYVVHVGDTRAYLHRGARLLQITTDHTIGNALAGERIAPAIRRILWNVIGGGSSDLQPAVYHLTLQPDDTLLLCTDGLTRHLPDDRIISLLDSSPTAEVACDHLVREANEQGGKDNVTTVVARFRSAERSSDPASETTRRIPVAQP